MTAKITFTQKEECALRAHSHLNPHLQSLLSKMEKARDKSKEVKFSGISVGNFLSLAFDKLGDRLKSHPNPTSDWFTKMQKVINSAGITQELAEKALNVAASTWNNGEIWIETLIYSLPKLAAGVAQSNLPFKKSTGFSPGKKSGWLAQLEDE